MARLEDLKNGASVKGILPDCLVTVVDCKRRMKSEALVGGRSVKHSDTFSPFVLSSKQVGGKGVHGYGDVERHPPADTGGR